MPPSKDEPSPELDAARSRVEERVFSGRLFIGLVVAALGVAVAQPGTLWGEWAWTGHAVSASLVLAGLALRFWAGGCAGDHTHESEIRAPQLATTGPYAHVRNPIYLGSIVLGLGMVGLIGDARLLPLWAATFLVLYWIIIPAEERFLHRRFGEPYAAYRRAVPRLLPRARPWRRGAPRPFTWGAVARGETRILVVLLCIYCAMEWVEWLRQT